jgi:hypothetical protein
MIEAIRAQQRYAGKAQDSRAKLLQMRKQRTAKALIPEVLILKILVGRDLEPRLSKASLARRLRIPAQTVYNVTSRYELVRNPAGKHSYKSREP